MRAQAEPHIIRSPVNPEYLIATFQEGRFTDGSAVNCGYSVSRDGGLSWSRALIPGTTASTGGPYPRLTDPVAGVAPSGNAYLNTLWAGSATQVGAILVSRSTNGDTFNAPRIAYQAPTTSNLPDKNWMAINTFAGTPTAGRIVVTFTLFQPGETGPHPILRVFSDDAGENWSQAALVHSGNLQVQGSQPVFLPDGRLAIVYWNFNGTNDFSDDFLELVVSPDGGATFGAPKFITAVNIYDAPAMRDGAFLPSATTDRTTGTLFVAYQALQNGSPRIMFTKSANAGTTWSTPVPISDNPGSAVFNAAITASPDGQKLAVSFYDTRDNPGLSTMLDFYIAHSFDGGATWQPNIRATSVSTNATIAPLTPGGYMLGDYQGIAEPTNSLVPAVPVWVDTRTANSDPFTSRVRIIPPFTPAPPADFDHNSNVDIIWQNNRTGQSAIWLMNQTTRIAQSYLPVVALEWVIAGTGDFNSDGQTDIIWQNNATGQRAVWLMNGSTIMERRYLPTAAVQWQIAGTGDFNRDGKVDIIWQNISTGQRVVWLMNGTTRIGAVYLPTVSTAWQIAAVADFNRDGFVDLLWQQTFTGQRAIWLMNGTTKVADRYLPTSATEWRIAGAGEFNADGQTDILWENTGTGQRAIWFMNETHQIGEFFLPTVVTEWEIRNH